MKKIISFLSELAGNNNKTWFDAHKADYLEAQSTFNNFAVKLLAGLGDFDESVRNLEVKDCTYRIYRDIRFSKDKTPYKTHMGTFIAPGGKSSGKAGYYFHIEPESARYLGGHMICSGSYMPAPKSVKSVREEIFLNGDEFESTIKEANGFQLDFDRALKKVPTGYSPDFKYSRYLKLRDFILCKEVNDDYILDKSLLENVLKDFKMTYRFNVLVNKAIDFSDEVS